MIDCEAHDVAVIEVSRLQQRVAELEAALTPFGDAYRFTQQMSAFMRQQYQVSMTCTGKVTVADLHRAAELTSK